MHGGLDSIQMMMCTPMFIWCSVVKWQVPIRAQKRVWNWFSVDENFSAVGRIIYLKTCRAFVMNLFFRTLLRTWQPNKEFWSIPETSTITGFTMTLVPNGSSVLQYPECSKVLNPKLSLLCHSISKFTSSSLIPFIFIRIQLVSYWGMWWEQHYAILHF